MSMAMPDHQHRPDYYGLAKIRSSFVHFLFGKGFGAFAALLSVVLIIRELPISEYAIYATLHAMVMMLRLLTSFGINSTALRFIPDTRVEGNNRAAYALLFGGVTLRAAFYVVVVLLLYFVAGDAIASLLGLTGFEWAYLIYLVTGFFRVTCFFYVGALESLLWQKQAQYTIAAANLLKVVLLLFLINTVGLSLVNVIIVELVCEAIALLALVATSILSWRKDPHRHEGDAGILRRDWRRYGRFSFWAYLFNLTAVLNGSAPNRIIVAAFLGPTQVALFAAVDRLAQFVKQYEPVKLLMGLFRPVLNSRYKEKSDFPVIMGLADSMFRINLVALAAPLIVVAVAGESVFDILTNGKYVSGYTLFIGLLGVLILGSMMLTLELLVKAVELTQIFTLSNIVLSGSVFAAFPFFDQLGVWALVLANAAGHCLAIGIIIVYLERNGFDVHFSRLEIGKIVFGAAAAIVAGNIVAGALPDAWWIVAVLTAGAVFLGSLAMFMPFNQNEIAVVKRTLRRREAADAH
jgi:O-antigen/teichoic acid export membrane protein